MDALAIAALSMQNDMSQLEAISQNLANVMTPGFKREIHVNRAFDAHFDTAGAGDAATHADAMGGRSFVIDPTVGTMRATAAPLDIAIESKGFLEVTTDNGVAYTRQGALHLDPSGRLVTSGGYAISGLGGELRLTGGDLKIDSEGKLQQGGKTVGQLKLVQFDNQQLLDPLGGGLFAQGGAQLSNTAVTAKFKTGYLEASNVSSAQEMVRLNETVRHFESMQKMLQGYDDVFQKAITKLGDF